MAGQRPSSLALSWTCAIEALANIKEISVTTLIKIFHKSPQNTFGVESNARELVSLRILERLFVPDNKTKSLLCAPSSGVTFDLSEHCEDVLRRIVGEMRDLNIWDESEKSKWNAQPFISYKRSFLLKSYLKHVKEGSPSYLISLKQMVTSLRLNQLGTRTHDVDSTTTTTTTTKPSKIPHTDNAMFNNQQHSPRIAHEMCEYTSSDHTRMIRSNGGNGDDLDESIESESSDGCYHKETNNIATKKQVLYSSSCKDGEVDTHRKDTNHDMDVHGSVESQSSTDEWYHKEINDIASKKQVFFGPSCKDGEFRKDANCCMKCHKGGQLLRCVSNACPFVFHESCLVSTSFLDYDSTGKIDCPFCRYSQAISDYRVDKRKASSARNDLVSFSSSTFKHIPKRSHKRDNNEVTQVINTRCKGDNIGVERAWPLRIYVSGDNDQFSQGEKGKADGDLALNKRNLKKESDGCRMKGVKRPLTREQSIHENRAKSQRPNGVGGREGYNEGSSKQAGHMDPSSCMQIKPCTSFIYPPTRRAQLPWTELEEATLKKWMEQYLRVDSIQYTSIPWRKILELGASNFQKGRKPGDLKDKWRNMQKGSKNLV